MGVIGGIAIGMLVDSGSYDIATTRVTHDHVGARTDGELGVEVSRTVAVQLHGLAAVSYDLGSHASAIDLGIRYRIVDQLSIAAGFGLESYWIDSPGEREQVGASTSAYTLEMAAHYVLACGCDDRRIELSAWLELPLSISSERSVSPPAADRFWTGAVGVGYHWGS